MTRPWETLAVVSTPEGPLELRRRGEDEFLIVIGGRVLMTSSARRSEEELGRLAAPRLPAPRVLVGGLGMGFTLRALLDAVPAEARVDLAELHPTIVEWCRGPLAGLTGNAIADPRVTLHIADVAQIIAAARPGAYDAIVLDLYEGPYTRSQPREHPVFGDAALGRARAALAPGGTLAVWGEDEDAGFRRRLARAGFAAEVHRSGGGRTHVVYLAASGVSRKR